MAFLKQPQVARMAEAGLVNFEVSADWNAAKREMVEYCNEAYGFEPSNSLVLLCLKMAKIRWAEIMRTVKNEIEENS